MQGKDQEKRVQNVLKQSDAKLFLKVIYFTWNKPEISHYLPTASGIALNNFAKYLQFAGGDHYLSKMKGWSQQLGSAIHIIMPVDYEASMKYIIIN